MISFCCHSLGLSEERIYIRRKIGFYITIRKREKHEIIHEKGRNRGRWRRMGEVLRRRCDVINESI